MHNSTTVHVQYMCTAPVQGGRIYMYMYIGRLKKLLIFHCSMHARYACIQNLPIAIFWRITK